jgi:hypothetical protein
MVFQFKQTGIRVAVAEHGPEYRMLRLRGVGRVIKYSSAVALERRTPILIGNPGATVLRIEPVGPADWELRLLQAEQRLEA